MPAISVIIPSYNAATTLPLQLDSLFDQDQEHPFELLVVDNGSTDNTHEVLDAAQAPPHVALRSITATEYQSTGYARNVGIRHSTGDLLLFCDADDVVSHWWLSHALATFTVTPLWSGPCLPLADHVFHSDLAHIRQQFGDSGDWVPPVREQEGSHFPVLMGGCCGATRDVIVELQGFDVFAPDGGEDNDLAIRARAAGYPAYTCKSTRIGYRQKTNRASQRRAAKTAARAHVLNAKRHRLWQHSHLRRWWIHLAKTVAAAVMMIARPRSRHDWDAVKTRAAVALTVAATDLRTMVTPQPSAPSRGIGLGMQEAPNHNE